MVCDSTFCENILLKLVLLKALRSFCSLLSVANYERIHEKSLDTYFILSSNKFLYYVGRFVIHEEQNGECVILVGDGGDKHAEAEVCLNARLVLARGCAGLPLRLEPGTRHHCATLHVRPARHQIHSAVGRQRRSGKPPTSFNCLRCP